MGRLLQVLAKNALFHSRTTLPWKLSVNQYCHATKFILQQKRNDIRGCSLCSALRPFHTTTDKWKRRQTETTPIDYTPLYKKKAPMVEVWHGMTVRDIAKVSQKTLDHIFEAMLYVDGADQYDRADMPINDMKIISEILKKCGLKGEIVSRKTDGNAAESKDIGPRPPADPASLRYRPPIVTVMGHVDHGKTTLLDSLRNTNVVDSEFGGITQHIGAFTVKVEKSSITFLDTPGHAAFTAMRARGAYVTDMIVLVVAADDGVMQQTLESIHLAKEAKVPIIVAINKIDKPNIDIDHTKGMLLAQGILLEDQGGDVQAIPISALKGTNLDVLTEAILAQAELMQLKAPTSGLVEGIVIESKVDPRRGKLCTAIIQRGTLGKGNVLVAGTAFAKVRGMFDAMGAMLQTAPPSTPVEIIGWKSLPSAGELILEVESEKRAREVTEWREKEKLQQKQESDAVAVQAKMEEHLQTYKVQLAEKRRLGFHRLRRKGPRPKEYIEDTSLKVAVILKGDVDGSVDAILDVFDTYDYHDDCRLDIVHFGVGDITENDVDLAHAFKAIVYGFNVKLSNNVKELAKGKNVSIKQYNIIYRIIQDLQDEISSRLPKKPVEEILGTAQVLQEFLVSEGKLKLPVAGCRCTKGTLTKKALYRLRRGEDILYEGNLASMRHLKEEVRSVGKDMECGLRFEDPEIKFLPGDVIECYEISHVSVRTPWDPGFRV